MAVNIPGCRWPSFLIIVFSYEQLSDSTESLKKLTKRRLVRMRMPLHKLKNNLILQARKGNWFVREIIFCLYFLENWFNSSNHPHLRRL